MSMRYKEYYSSDSDDFSYQKQDPLCSMMAQSMDSHSRSDYLVLRTSSLNLENSRGCYDNTEDTMTVSMSGGQGQGKDDSSSAGQGQGQAQSSDFSSILSHLGVSSETMLQYASRYLLIFLSSPLRLAWFLLVLVAFLFFYPMTSVAIIGALAMTLMGGNRKGDDKIKRTARWTVTSFSLQMKDGLLVSPPFQDQSGQWRMVVRQKKGMDGLQTMFGLLCTDVFPEVEMVTANVTFYCTNQLGQEVGSGGGTRYLNFQHDYWCPGDCGYSRPVRVSRKHLGAGEVITIHCTIEFHKKPVTFLKTLSASISRDLGSSEDFRPKKRGKNVVKEHGAVFPGDLEFHEEDSLPASFRPVVRFVRHRESRTFIWEIPGFSTLLENSELWGLYSPQFFVHCHDVCTIWRMKLMEVQGVFRLHVQLRGLPRTLKQVKLWYLMQLVDAYGDSVIPEHAVCRVKYPDIMNLWDTTRHILYRRDTILERFVSDSGTLTLRITLQMEPNDLTLMTVDSDDWIGSPAATGTNLNLNNALESGSVTVTGNSLKMLQHQPAY